MSHINEILQTMDYGPSPESAAAAQQWLDRHQRSFGLYINGAWTPAATQFETRNPATGDTLAQVAQASDADVDAAVAAATAALGPWQKLGGHRRARYLYALARALQKHSRLFAVLECLDNGKPIRETRDADVPLAVRHFYHHAGWAQLLDTELPQHRALGVVGQIVPWNFPLLMLAWKIAPALACGNTVVFKPAEFTPLTALLFAEICTEVGLPPGVVNIVTGDGSTGQRIVSHPVIAKIAFTGSTEVGRLIREATAGSGKKLSLELGGKSPFIVFADADLDAAVEGLVDSIWFNQGQVCCAGSRLLVHEAVEQRFLDKLRRRMENIRVGSPMDKSTDMGALIDASQQQRIARYVAQAREEGATVWQPTGELPGAGCFYPPTLITDVSTSATVVQEEIFGPVLVAMSFRTPAEAVELANNTVYGLAACVWSESISLALDVAPRLKAGVVWINTANQFDAACGFGGYRESGYGREGGREGLLEYLVACTEDARPASPKKLAATQGTTVDASAIDRTPKLYIGGAQVRPDSGYSVEVRLGDQVLGQVPEGNRKDIRNAVEAARKAVGWERSTGHARAQVLYFIAENLEAQRARFVAALAQVQPVVDAQREFDASIETLFHYAAWADKFDGAVHQPPMHGIVAALNEALGVIGIVCPDEAPLLGLVALAAPAIALGNRVVLLPSTTLPTIATDLYQVLDTSDLPGGVLNIVTGPVAALASTLASHADVDAIWRHDGDAAGCAEVECLSIANLKRTWVGGGKGRVWADPAQGRGPEFLRHASQVKNIWVPYGT
ncbi:aldehyde dehydrogenase family protein [Variovorax robiniae]|uniref:Aldehyde dehydrogenase family protein n=1 Tax=Variovorax robiniae TaxID=1836199 RepID=A0ABU8WZJ9_9BURK